MGPSCSYHRLFFHCRIGWENVNAEAEIRRESGRRRRANESTGRRRLPSPICLVSLPCYPVNCFICCIRISIIIRFRFRIFLRRLRTSASFGDSAVERLFAVEGIGNVRRG